MTDDSTTNPFIESMNKKIWLYKSRDILKEKLNLCIEEGRKDGLEIGKQEIMGILGLLYGSHIRDFAQNKEIDSHVEDLIRSQIRTIKSYLLEMHLLLSELNQDQRGYILRRMHLIYD